MTFRLETVKFSDASAGGFGPDMVRFLTDSDQAQMWNAAVRRLARRRRVAQRERRRNELTIMARQIESERPGISWNDALIAARDIRTAEERAAIERRILETQEPSNLSLLPYMVDDELAFRHSLIRTHAERRAAESRRLSVGYEWKGGKPHGGAAQAPFVYQGLRSTDHPLIARFVSTLPKVRRPIRGEKEFHGLMAGYDKGWLEAATSKLVALDAPYVEGTKSLRGWWRVDNDGCFPSWQSLWFCLAHAGIPMPHLAIADVLDDGRVLKPHLVWFLPAGSPVRFDARAPSKPQALWYGILKALHAATIDIGSDPGGCKNPMRVKNACSPHWGVCVLNESDPLTMSEMTEALAGFMSLSDEEMARRHAAAWAEKSGVAKTESNALFGDCIRASWNLMREWKRTGDHRASLEGDQLAAAFVDELGPSVRKALPDGTRKARQAMAILRKAADHAARTYDPAKADTRRRRGILKDEVKGMDLAERQAAGAVFVAQDRKDGTIDAIRAAVRGMQAAGETVTQAEVARRTGKARRTVIRRWSEACDGLIPGVTNGVKKKSTHRTGASNPSSQPHIVQPAPRRKPTVKPTYQFKRPSFLNRATPGTAPVATKTPPVVPFPILAIEPHSNRTEEASTGRPTVASMRPAFMRAGYDERKVELERRAAAPLTGTRFR